MKNFGFGDGSTVTKHAQWSHLWLHSKQRDPTTSYCMSLLTPGPSCSSTDDKDNPNSSLKAQAACQITVLKELRRGSGKHQGWHKGAHKDTQGTAYKLTHLCTRGLWLASNSVPVKHSMVTPWGQKGRSQLPPLLLSPACRYITPSLPDVRLCCLFDPSTSQCNPLIWQRILSSAILFS